MWAHVCPQGIEIRPQCCLGIPTSHGTISASRRHACAHIRLGVINFIIRLHSLPTESLSWITKLERIVNASMCSAAIHAFIPKVACLFLMFCPQMISGSKIPNSCRKPAPLGIPTKGGRPWSGRHSLWEAATGRLVYGGWLLAYIGIFAPRCHWPTKHFAKNHSAT